MTIGVGGSTAEAELGKMRPMREAIVPIDDALNFKKPVAFVVPRPGSRLGEDEVRRFALTNAAPYLHPRRVWFLDEMPLAGTNKIDRRALADRAAALLAETTGTSG